VFAWLVHALTASGVVIAYLALRATASGDVREAFFWLALATAIDAVDGWLARRARVKERTPGFDGARLDDIVDYLTFVFVPAWIMRSVGSLPAGAAGDVVVAAVLLSSAYGFSRADAKTADHFFTGFPSYWNIVAAYVVALQLSPAVNAGVVLGLAALVFVPIGYVYPSRTPVLQRTTIGLGLLWGIGMIAMVWRLPGPPRWLTLATLTFPAYYLMLSLVLHGRRTRNAPSRAT
jgi:phosphatidylcholine synthase